MSKCIICFKIHNHMWYNEPNMYCETCAPIREQARGVASEILDNLFLSDVIAAKNFDGVRICVHENHPRYDGHFHHVAVLAKPPNSKDDRTGAIASIDQLNYVADLIDFHLKTNKNKLLVHCWGGIERSPLTLAWYLIKHKHCKDFDEAYEFLTSKRPVVSKRLFWLPEGYKLP